MRKIILITALVLGTVFSSTAQGLPIKSGSSSESNATPLDLTNSELKSDIQDVANSVVSKVASSQCCSRFGAKNTVAVIDWDQCYYNRLKNTYIIKVTLQWNGAWTGSQYWVSGKLRLRYESMGDGTVRELRDFEKTDMSPGLMPGCVEDCNINSNF